MRVEVTVPSEFQGTIMGDLNRRKGVIMDSSTHGDDCVVIAEVPLNSMFGYSSVLRSNTQVSPAAALPSEVWGSSQRGVGHHCVVRRYELVWHHCVAWRYKLVLLLPCLVVCSLSGLPRIQHLGIPHAAGQKRKFGGNVPPPATIKI
eukprot:365293-Chlamydomonas_euryale.AAC.6